MKNPLVFAVAQLDLVVGDLSANADRILESLEQARVRGAHLLLTPELALSGYPPEDLLLRPDFHRSCEREIARIASSVSSSAHAGGALLQRSFGDP
jgi:predicted amidohydrolase